MNPIRLALLFAALQVFAPVSGPLRVLRVMPTGPANPDDPVTVTFDRPVAGGLGATVDAASIFRIAPAVPGKVEWRDPVTLRFTPASPLEPGASYTITIAATFEAMDGSRLEAPFEHTFRVSPPRVLAGWPVGAHVAANHLPERPVFSLLVSAPVEPRVLAGLSQIRLGASCGGAIVPLRAVGIRKVGDRDPGTFRYIGYAGAYPQDTARDLRRVVELEPATPLPLACSAELRVPQTVEAASPGRHAWRFSTYGPFRMTAAACGGGKWCATGPARVDFSTPVRGSEVLRHLRIEPNVEFTVRDTAEEASTWILEATLAPRQHYAIVVDTAIRDVFGQRLEGAGVRAFATTGYAPSVAYEFGKLLVEREGLRTLAVQHVNVDSLEVTAAPVPDSMIAAFLGQSWGWQEPWQALVKGARRWTVPAVGGVDERRVTGVRLPAAEEIGGGFGPLLAVQVAGVPRDSTAPGRRPIALVQVTDLAVHVRLGADQAAVWVTGVSDGLPRPGAEVVLHDAKGKVRATGRTDARGLALLDPLSPLADDCGGWGCGGLEGYVVASLGSDRAIVGVTAYDPDLSPWRFGARSAWGPEREPVAAGVFTERGIYRPGEAVHAKAIVREGTLGALRVPPAGDSLRWIFRDREDGILDEATVPLGEFGTADRAIELGPDLPLGHYRVEAQLRRNGEWRTVASAHYQVAEYRPPEFLVDVESDASPRLAGDSLEVHVGARYLFGAPMAGAPVRWVVRQRPVSPWELEIPGTEGYDVGSGYDWWDDSPGEGTRVTGEGVDTLDAAGRLDLRLVVPEPAAGRPARVDVLATVTDANRQTVSAATSLTVHPATFYIAARPRGRSYFWTAGSPVTLDLLAVRPEGERVEGVAVRGTVVRREWHRVRRIRGGAVEYVGSWVADTVATCNAVTGREPVTCGFTPPAGGAYVVTLTATDEKGRTATTRFTRWAAGKDWVPWNDDSQLRMDVIPDRERYTVGDTATILLASPFTDAEAWITVERERVLESRRIRVSSGATTLKLPITEAHAPNAFVSVVVVRGRSAAPGPLDDPGRPTLRVGYAELRVTPEVKRLAVEVRPERPEYRPGDTARIRLAVRDATGRGRKAEVTLWAVDEGVLALTGYRTPDPIDLLYPPRGLGMRLASNLVAVAAQVPDGQKGRREPGGGGGADLTGILRSRFQTTAFFLGSVVTAEDGTATAAAKLPDNLTTFRVMAVAVTAGDRYGSGESELLVSRPLLARPALPRFVREGDRFEAGVVVNSRLAGERKVTVAAEARGIRLEAKSKREERVRPGRGVEARFGFTATAGDSARFRFAVSADKEADAVAVAVPVRPSYHSLAQTIAGVLHDTASATFALGADVDPARSTLEVHVGTSPLAFLNGARREMEIYPYFCTEQIMSGVLPLIALYRAGLEGDVGAVGSGRAAGGGQIPGTGPSADGASAATAGTGGNGAPADDPRMAAQIETAVRTLSRRQRPDGGIGYWSSSDWTSPWLSAYAGRVLLEAREAGIAVSDTVLSRLADYLARSLREPLEARFAVARWHGELGNTLAERLAAADFLSRLGRPDVAAENSLLAQAARMHWEDRVLLAEVLARRGRSAEARLLLAHALEGVRVEGRTAVLPDSAVGGHYFGSRARPAARLLDALLAVDPASPIVGPLVETLVSRGRVEATRFWNTQDYGFAALALMNFERLGRAAGSTRVRVDAGGRKILDVGAAAMSPRETTVSLAGLVERDDDGRPVARVRLRGDGGGPVFYFLTVREAPKAPQLQPVDRGIQVERWYEDVRTGHPITSVAEGELVRVRLRVTVPAERNFVVLDDPLPAGLEPVDLSLRTVSPFGGEEALTGEMYSEQGGGWAYGSWDSGLWSPFDHKEMRDDRVVYSATVLWKGSHTATYLARATTAGTFLYPPAHAEEMYNPGVNGRSGGGTFTVTKGGQ